MTGQGGTAVSDGRGEGRRSVTGGGGMAVSDGQGGTAVSDGRGREALEGLGSRR